MDLTKPDTVTHRAEAAELLGISDQASLPGVPATPGEAALILQAPGPRAELVTVGDRRAALAYPAEVVPAVRTERVRDLCVRALTLEVHSAEDFRAASELLKVGDVEVKAQEERVTELRRPYTETANRISSESKANPDLSMYRDTVRPHLETQIKRWNDAERVRVERERAEAERVRAENERRRREAEAARAAEEARLRAEAEALRLEAERKARAAEEAARQAAELAQGDLAEDPLAAVLAVNVADQAAEEAARQAAEIEARLAAAQAAPVEVVQEAVPVVAEIVQPKNAAKVVQVPVIDGPIDLSKLPMDYHMADESKILKALKLGLTIPGVKFHLEADVKAKRGAMR